MRVISPRTARWVAAVLVSPTLALAPAHAQMGSAFKKLKQKAEETAAQKVVGEGAPMVKTPVASPNLVKIESSSIDQLLAGLAAEAAEAQRRSQDSVAYAQKKAAWETCDADHRAKRERADRDMHAANDAPLEAMARRAADAAKRGDMKTMQLISDSLTKAMAAAQARSSAQAGPDCGESPSNPFGRMRGSANSLASAGAQAANLPLKQYALLRERVAHWVLVQGKVGPGQWAYWPDELSAMSARQSELARFASYFRESSAESSWGVQG
jgi:hypothetical protein